MKTTEIRNMPATEIRDRIKAEEEQLQQARFKHAVGTLSVPIQIRTSRRLIARLKTVLNEKEQA